MATVKPIRKLSQVPAQMFDPDPVMRPIHPVFCIGNKLMHPREPSLTHFFIAGDQLIVEIHPSHMTQARTPIGIHHGARSNPGGHKLLGMGLGFFPDQHLGKAGPTAGPAFRIHPGLRLNGYQHIALIPARSTAKRPRIQLQHALTNLIAGIPVLQGGANLLQHPPHTAIRLHAQMPLELLRRHPSFALHDIKHRLDPEEQGGLGGLKGRPRPHAHLAEARAARANFGTGADGIKGLGVTGRTLELFALKATAPQQRSGLSFSRDLGKEPLRRKRLVEQPSPPNPGFQGERIGHQSVALYQNQSLCAFS